MPPFDLIGFDGDDTLWHNERDPLMLITKGDLLHQRAKVDRSGLGRYFRHIEVVSHKNEA